MSTAKQQLTLRNHSNTAFPTISKNIGPSMIENRRKIVQLRAFSALARENNAKLTRLMLTPCAHTSGRIFYDMTAATVSGTWV
jgi:hypothetical protein